VILETAGIKLIINKNLNLGRFCCLEDFSTCEGFLKETIGLSTSKVKSLLPQKKQRERKLRKGIEDSLPLNIFNYGEINPCYDGPAIQVLKREKRYLCLSKPSLCHSHPLSYEESDNLLSYLRDQGEFQSLVVNHFSYDRGLLYRLDYETSGIIILALDDELYREVRGNFHKLARRKTYLTIVEGKVEKQRLQHHLSESGKKIKVLESGKEAICHVRPLLYCDREKATLLEVQLETGLRHQIRVQLADIGHPIWGDQLYGGREAERLFLHAYAYSLRVNDQLVIDGKDDQGNGLLLFRRFFDLDSCLKMLSDKS
jgi:23S rRNA pseudouridine1911/1915/1917 synthase